MELMNIQPQLKDVSLPPVFEEILDIQTWVEASRARTPISIDKIPGDASARQYFRVAMDPTQKNSSFILMKMGTFEGDTPFLQTQRHLEQVGVPVPKIHDLDASRGLILLEDLGDETLLKRLQSSSKPKEQLDLFRRAIDLMVHMQTQATLNKASIDAYGLYFDEEKLNWEVNFTLTHFYNGVLARGVPDEDMKKVRAYFTAICRRLAQEQWFFTHRDFHSRNIMVHDEELFMIDFQDARMGCCQYDLASLLRDSYYQLEEDAILELLEYSYKKLLPHFKPSQTFKQFCEIFDLMSIQRNFKAIGSFASFFNKRADVRYLKFIGNTFENVRRNLTKFPELEPLRHLLFQYYYF